MRVASVDCGTNSIRLLIADVADDGPLRDVHREMRVVRLGQGVDATGELAPEAIERTRLALVDYAGVIRDTGAERVRMVATSASRDARNRGAFVAMVNQVLGVDPEVITGDEEARASFAGAVGDLAAADVPFVVTDLGGGSTEVVAGDAGGVTGAHSADVGCVRLTERCLTDDPPTDQQVSAARDVAQERLAGAFAAVDVRGASTWVGVAGHADHDRRAGRRAHRVRPRGDPPVAGAAEPGARGVRGTAGHDAGATGRAGADAPGTRRRDRGRSDRHRRAGDGAGRRAQASPSWWSASTTSSTGSRWACGEAGAVVRRVLW